MPYAIVSVVTNDIYFNLSCRAYASVGVHKTQQRQEQVGVMIDPAPMLLYVR